MAEKVNNFLMWLALLLGLSSFAAMVCIAIWKESQPLPKSEQWPTPEIVRHERTRLAFEQMVRNIDARSELPEIMPYPGYVEQDDRIVTMRIGDKVIVPDWWTPNQHREPYREDELLRRWQARDGTVFKIVPKGELP